MIPINMTATQDYNKAGRKASQDVNVVAERLSEMMSTQFFNTMLESMNQDLEKGMYNYFLAEGIVTGDEKSGLREHFKKAFFQQLQANIKIEDRVENNPAYGLSVYSKHQAVHGEKNA